MSKFKAFPLLLATAFTVGATATNAEAVLTPAGGPETSTDGKYQNYTDFADGELLQGFLSIPQGIDSDSSLPGASAKLPAIIVLHDASGPDLYEQQRATIISQQYGYVGFAADIFGFYAELPPEDAPWSIRGAFTGQYTNNATLFTQRIQAALDFVQALDYVDATKVGLVGYCMGGTGVVHYVNVMGEAVEVGDVPPLAAGAVSVHPALTPDGPGPNGSIDVPTLFLTGGADFLTGPASMEKLESDMKAGHNQDGVAPWESVRYAKINHAFSNWFSGRYDERADARSWYSQMNFFAGVFSDTTVDTTVVEQPIVTLSSEEVDYTDPMGSDLKGYLHTPPNADISQSLPIIVILPHTTDRSYEESRAAKLSLDAGYYTFEADAYTTNDSDMNLQLSRIRAAISHVKTIPGVDPSNIALVGFGSGGTGAMYYALQTGVSDIAAEDSVKAIASFHGHLDRVAIATVGMVPENESAEGDAQAWGGDSRKLAAVSPHQPQILIQSGVDADSMKDIIQIESTLISLGTNYELTRFSDTVDNFTIWGDENYNAVASSRSFDQLRTTLAESFGPSESGNDAYPEPQDPAEGDDTTSSSSHVPTLVAIIAAGLAVVAF